MLELYSGHRIVLFDFDLSFLQLFSPFGCSCTSRAFRMIHSWGLLHLSEFPRGGGPGTFQIECALVAYVGMWLSLIWRFLVVVAPRLLSTLRPHIYGHG